MSSVGEEEGAYWELLAGVVLGIVVVEKGIVLWPDV